MRERKYFSLVEARALLPEIREITSSSYQNIENIEQLYIQHKIDKKEANSNIQTIVEEWVRGVTKHGVEVKGLWLVDFDSGDGYYYCWKYNEEDILFFHLYETGIQGRRPIDLLER